MKISSTYDTLPQYLITSIKEANITMIQLFRDNDINISSFLDENDNYSDTDLFKVVDTYSLFSRISKINNKKLYAREKTKGILLLCNDIEYTLNRILRSINQ